ncbi:MAG TPA: hypothetical protein VGA29_04850 [Ignavibacteriaceae bacterium]|jgi:hypothetical protein
MHKVLFAFIVLVCFKSQSFSQQKLEVDIEIAYLNAKKGIYWALDNIPQKKLKLENELIAEDKLYAKVKLEIEIEGIKIESTGYYHSNEVNIKIYKSNDSLVKEGYLRN